MHISMHPCVHASLHLCIHASMHPCLDEQMHPCIHASMHPCIHASLHPCIYASMHPCMHAQMHPCIYVSMHLRIHASMIFVMASFFICSYCFCFKVNSGIWVPWCYHGALLVLLASMVASISRSFQFRRLFDVGYRCIWARTLLPANVLMVCLT